MEKRNCPIFRFFDWQVARRFASLTQVFLFLIILITNPFASHADETAANPEMPVTRAPFDGQYIIHLSENSRVRESGRPEPGYFDSLAIELFDKAGLDARIVEQMPWKRLLEQAAHGSGHVLYPTTRSEERENKFKWVGPVSRTLWNLYGFAKDGWADQGFESLLVNARIGVLMASAREAYLRERGAERLVVVPREELLLPMMQAGRIDLIAIGGNILNHYVEEANTKANGAEIADIDGVVPYRSCYLYIAISGDVPDEDVSRLQEQLDQFKTDGFFLANRQSHGLSTNPESGFIRAMLNLGNNGVSCIDLAGVDN